MHGLNETSFQLTSDGRIWFIFGCYLTLYETSKIKSVVAAIGRRPHGAAPLMAKDFTSNLAAPEGNCCREEITAVIENSGLEDTSTHFLPRRKYWARDGRTWCMHHQGRDVRSQKYYFLGTDQCLFQICIRPVLPAQL